MASKSTSRPSSAADPYTDSFVSLITKSEIRYEGVAYNINTEESTIGLRNVRSLGTEGRKKDSQQIPPGVKVYDYILFCRSEIKDLQVKPLPPVQPTPQFNNDPAAIQSHYPHPVNTSTSLPSVASASLADHSSHATQLGNPGSNFQGPSPLYQSEGNIGSWGISPSTPNANGGGLTMPIDSQGYYAAPNGVPHLHQSLLPLPFGSSIPSSFQQPMQYSDFSPSLPTGSSNLPELPSSLLHEAWACPYHSALTNSGSDIKAIVWPLSIKPNALYCSSSTYETVPQLSLAIVGSTNSISTETQAPSLVSSRSSPEPSLLVFAENQPPILPLAVTSWPFHMPGGAPIQIHHGYSERRRGTGVWHPVIKFTQDSDFMAKKEKLKKDGVRGHLDKEENAFIEDGDAFFDPLSSNALDQASQNGRTKYSEQIKNDTETIGDFVSHRGGRGGRDPSNGGRGGRGPSNGGRGGRGPSNGGRGGRGPSNGVRGGRGPSDGGRGGHGPSDGGRGGRGPSDGGRGGRAPSDGGRGDRGPSTEGSGAPPSRGGRGGRGPSHGGRRSDGPSRGGHHCRGGYAGTGRSMPSHSS
ncbi:hypothetical protein TanjilG_07784 [Lupinus angustifolius]|uniref:Lsm14-like N-terminal domain-containing protein n=1 Tax=Lupinus angustifolius TaxID=3871 RepID=A0A1J7HQH2_LUPAN|nr:hypothetical protein TanjilG_07784 [Lupinus angustifolius]